MPWAHGDSYKKQSDAELKHLLRLRNLNDDGTKKQMVSLLISHDERYHFPFLKLPDEVRCQIYMLVAAEDACEPRRSSQPAQISTEGVLCGRKLRAIAASSSLFRACRETKNEGLLLFYEHHHFELDVEEDGCLRAIRRWLRHIGQAMRENIRHLEIRFIEEPDLTHMGNMGRIHGGLSDKATVMYHTNDGVSQLWQMGATCWRRDRSSVPTFQMWGEYGLDEEWTTYDRPPSFRTVPGRRVEVECSLVFLPGESWFGPAGPRSVY